MAKDKYGKDPLECSSFWFTGLSSGTCSRPLLSLSPAVRLCRNYYISVKFSTPSFIKTPFNPSTCCFSLPSCFVQGRLFNYYTAIKLMKFFLLLVHYHEWFQEVILDSENCNASLWSTLNLQRLRILTNFQRSASLFHKFSCVIGEDRGRQD